jgi:hypothetical protein
MTDLTRPVTRKTRIVHGESTIVTVYPTAISFRRSRCRKAFIISLASCYKAAVEADLEARRREKRKGKRTLAKRGLLR